MGDKCDECMCLDCITEGCNRCETCGGTVTQCDKNDYTWINPHEE